MTAARKILTPAERRAASVEAMKDFPWRSGALQATLKGMLPVLAGALAEVRRHNQRGADHWNKQFCIHICAVPVEPGLAWVS